MLGEKQPTVDVDHVHELDHDVAHEEGDGEEGEEAGVAGLASHNHLGNSGFKLFLCLCFSSLSLSLLIIGTPWSPSCHNLPSSPSQHSFLFCLHQTVLSPRFSYQVPFPYSHPQALLCLLRASNRSFT